MNGNPVNPDPNPNPGNGNNNANDELVCGQIVDCLNAWPGPELRSGLRGTRG